MGNDIVPALDDIPHGEEGMRFLLGMLFRRVGDMGDTMNDVKKEQNTVHDIVDTMSEGVRLLNSKVEAMTPVVETYRLNEKDINRAVKAAMEYRDSTIEKRGMQKLLGPLIAAVGVIGGALGTLAIEAVKFYLGRRS